MIVIILPMSNNLKYKTNSFKNLHTLTPMLQYVCGVCTYLHESCLYQPPVVKHLLQKVTVVYTHTIDKIHRHGFDKFLYFFTGYIGGKYTRETLLKTLQEITAS